MKNIDWEVLGKVALKTFTTLFIGIAVAMIALFAALYLDLIGFMIVVCLFLIGFYIRTEYRIQVRYKNRYK